MEITPTGRGSTAPTHVICAPQTNESCTTTTKKTGCVNAQHSRDIGAGRSPHRASTAKTGRINETGLRKEIGSPRREPQNAQALRACTTSPSRQDLHHRPVTGTRNGRLARFGSQRRVCGDDLEGSRGISAAGARTRDPLLETSKSIRSAHTAEHGATQESTAVSHVRRLYAIFTQALREHTGRASRGAGLRLRRLRRRTPCAVNLSSRGRTRETRINP